MAHGANTNAHAHALSLTTHDVPKSPRPPPVNRADKPKIPAKPATINIQSGAGLTASDRKPSFEARVSPFNTPPSSDGGVSPSQSPEPEVSAPIPNPHRTLLAENPRVSVAKNAAALSSQPQPRPNDPRFMGFGAKPAAVERKDPRTLGLTTPEPRPPSREMTTPVRSATVSEKPIVRDARELGLSSGKPTSRPVSESFRPVPSPSPAAPQPPSRNPAIRDARQLGFSSPMTPPSAAVEAEPRPGLPPRRNIHEVPPRLSNDTKMASVRPLFQHPLPFAAPDRSTKPSPVPQISRVSTAPVDSRFLPPPKRASVDEGEQVSSPRPLIAGPPRLKTITDDPLKRQAAEHYSHDSDDEAEEASEEPSMVRTEYPDATQTNRRPPFLKSGLREIGTKADSRVVAACGQHLCTAGYVTRVFDMSSGEQIMNINHGETVKVVAVAFKPAVNLAGEGARLWLGTNIGEIHEIDIDTQTTIATNTSHNRREIVRILRCRKNLWTLDDDGKLFVWPADESGVPNLKYSHITHKVQRGHTFSMVVHDKLWLATGKEIRVYQPGNEGSFAALTKPLAQTGTGDVTSGTYSDEQGGRVYFGHIDGKVTIYSTRDYTCLANIKASDYKINGLAFVGEKLWAAYKTGKIYVYDTTTSPWKVQKDWRAHDGPTIGLLLDPNSIWTLQRLQVITMGHDNFVRLWDGMLEDDWIESKMQERDAEYCTFRDVRAAVVTWNVGAATPYDLRSDFVTDAIHAEDPPEILAFGFQEVVDLEDRAVTAKSILGFGKKKDPVKTEQHQSRVYREWRDYLHKVIGRYANAHYTELQTSSLIGLFQCVFIRQEEKQNVRDLCAASIKLGLKGRYGNKGALVTRFIVDDSSLCFINCHLAAGQTQTSHRNNDVATILEAESLPPQPDPDLQGSLYVGGGDGTQILDHEICILNGDLNYRIDAIPRDTVVNMIKRNELAKLLERDQIMLSRRRVSGFRLSPFTELPITFPPTYKYDVGTDNYDSSEKKRAPAWCDRLLYRGPGKIKQTEYRRHEIRVSDHRPVSGVFKIRVKTIDPWKRAKVKDECYDRFTEVSRKLAEKASVEYLVNNLGVVEREARKLIASG